MDNKWKYQSLAEYAAKAFSSHLRWIIDDEQQFTDAILHLLGKSYNMGFVDGYEVGKLSKEVIPVTDISHLPEVFAAIKERGNWGKKVCG